MKIKFKNLEDGTIVSDWELLPSQELFWKAQDRYILFSGGVGCGKSMVMLLRVIYECMAQDNNYFLVGRTTYGEIHDVLIKEFMELCHDTWIKAYTKTPHPTVILHTFNGKESTIIFRNLDSLSQGELLGLNLGGFAIDQAEDIPEAVFLTLKGRLRRAGIQHRVFMTSNPKLSWLYRAFKQEPEENYRLIEASTMENEKNLPSEYIKDLMNYPPSWKRQYLEGIWDEGLLADNIVFAREFIEKLGRYVRAPEKEREGLKIFKPYDKTHHYQIGVDCAEGTDTTEDSMRKTQKDSAVIVIWDKTTDEEVACYSGKVPPGILAEKFVLYASWYGNPEVLPEMNSMGVAFIDKIDSLGYQNIYRRKEYDKVLKKQLKKVGFRTTASSKQLLISHFNDMCRLRDPRVYSRETVEEMKTFVYTDNAKKKGAGAKEGFHDDRIMATLLAAFDEEKVVESSISHSSNNNGIIIPSKELVPTLNIVNGKFKPPPLPGEEKKYAKWTTF